MNSIVSLGFVALVSMVGMTLGYGSVGKAGLGGSGFTMNSGYPSAYYGGSYGYGNVGSFLGSSGGSGGSGGSQGIFGILIYLFIFITIIRAVSNRNNDDSSSSSRSSSRSRDNGDAYDY